MVALAFGASDVAAQADKKGIGTFSVDRKGPIRIQSASLEVRDKDKKATFRGNVHVTQGDTDVRCNVLVVHYNAEVRKSNLGAQKEPKEKATGGQIRFMEAQGDVIVTQKDQTATGDRAEFDMRTNTVTLIGNVVVTRGIDVLRGQRLVVDLTTGVSKMESGGGRVEGLFRSGQDKGKPAAPEPRKDNRNETRRPAGPSGLH